MLHSAALSGTLICDATRQQQAPSLRNSRTGRRFDGVVGVLWARSPMAERTGRLPAAIRPTGLAKPAPRSSTALGAFAAGVLGSFQDHDSVDPMARRPGDVYVPGKTWSIRSQEELDRFTEVNPDHPEQLVILMCKARACRPCKMFTRKYMHLAERFTSAIFLDITGDENKETCSMMMRMEVRSTPTFRLYKQGQLVDTTVGVNEAKLAAAIRRQLLPGEPGTELDEAELKQLQEEQLEEQDAAVPAELQAGVQAQHGA